MAQVIPAGDSARAAWLESIESAFPETGAALGFNQTEIESFIADCETVRFVIVYAKTAKAFSKAATKYKLAVFDGKSNAGDLPVFAALAQPAVLTGKGAFRRVKKAVRRMKEHPNFSPAIAAVLKIGAAKSAAASPDTAKPKGKAAALINSVVRIDWTKGKFHGVFVESRRGDETEWQEIGFDTRSPFVDARPPLFAGKPEERHYRLRYFLDDEAVGLYSDIIVVITQP